MLTIIRCWAIFVKHISLVKYEQDSLSYDLDYELYIKPLWKSVMDDNISYQGFSVYR